MPEEEYVEDDREEKRESRNHPDDEGKQHSEVDDSLLLVSGLGHRLNVLEELHKRRLILGGSMLSGGDELGLHNGP